MDPLPLIPEVLGHQNVASALREEFQETLKQPTYPKDIADNIVRYNVDAVLKFKQNACKVVEIHRKLNEKVEHVQDAGREIMIQQGYYLDMIDKIESIYDVKERTRLKHCKLFHDLKEQYVEYFGLLQKYDLLPDVLRQFLDYRLNKDLHLCENCIDVTIDDVQGGKKRAKREDKADERHKSKTKVGRGNKIGERSDMDENYDDLNIKGTRQYIDRKYTFTILPRKVLFHNYEIGKTYKKSFKLINISRRIISLNIGRLPRNSCFFVQLNSNSRMAPGMSITARITYKPVVYRNIQDCFSFRSNEGDEIVITITTSREPPKLITCVFKSHSRLLDRVTPGSLRFLEKRRIALNSTIDCGSCLVSEYTYLSVFVENSGKDGKFFIISEDEWYMQNIENVSNLMEFSNEHFWIYPTFFELKFQETTEINIIFHPYDPGLHIEKFYIICDNNSLEQFEILGDGLEFHKSMIKVDVIPNDVEIEKKQDYCIFLGDMMINNSVILTLSVHNTSSLILNCYWKFNHRPNDKFILDLNESRIKILNDNKILAPYSTTDFNFEISLNVADSGYYSIFFGFFIADIPIISLGEDEEFFIIEKEELAEKRLTECADVQILDVEVSCFVDVPESTETISINSCTCSPCESPRRPKLQFSSPFLEFGILASGLNVEKVIGIRTFCEDPVKWKIVEIKYNTDSPPYMEILQRENFSCDSGEFGCPCEIQKISYVTKKEPVRWVSMLLLMSTDEDTNLEIESICIVTYEVIDYDITINTEHGAVPILCPLKLLYTGVPVTLNFCIENHSLITGCFYFLSHYGEDIDHIKIDLDPRSSILNPLECKEVTATITCNDIGIFENIHVPCFIGAGQEPIILRILLAVDGIHVHFYLPEGKKSFQKVLWPPKVVYEFDEDWMICPCTLEHSPEFWDDVNSSQGTSSKDSKILSNVDNTDIIGSKDLQFNKSVENNSGVLSENQVAENTETDMEKSSKTTSTATSTSLYESDMKSILQDQFGDELLLQRNVVQVHQVPIKTATKMTFYFENNTPIPSSYRVEATNFYTDKKFDDTLFRLKLKKLDEIWNDMIMNQYGIVVQPEVDQGEIPVIGLIEVDVWIYATTWGIYMEEIVVDIPDVLSFAFSLLIEVVGSPIVLPLGLNAITQHPTIRFGKVAYKSQKINRKIKIDNISCIPVNILWHTFMKTSFDAETGSNFNLVLDMMDKSYFADERRLVFTDKYYGRETSCLFKISPAETIINGDSSYFVDIAMTPENFPTNLERTDVSCFIIGHIFLEERYRKKVNYFYRDTDEDFIQVKMETLASLELPLLTLDFICGETQMVMYANDVIFNKSKFKHVRLLFQNKNLTPAEVAIEIDEPFKILRIENGKLSKRRCCVKPLGCLEVLISTNIDHKKILELGRYMYRDTEKIESNGDGSFDNIMEAKIAHEIDRENKIMRIQKNFIIRGASTLSFPMDLYIHFPLISVKPTTIKLQSVLIGQTSKTLISIFNLTACKVTFEIYKSLATEELFIKPHYGEIPKSTGINKQFTDIFVYFTPRKCKVYVESIRVVTNIPNYYIEIPIKVTGSINEKFQVDYKI